ncbi:MAG: metalloregulator ArsR/SmtB family transcription factor [bacterium]|nr:metalloregulator ArsR/SmtB family transcription factor [bacterium]
MKELERTLRALGNRRRLSIVQFLKRNKEATVTELSEAINLSFRSTSRHLSILFGVGILEKRQQSTEVYYFLSPKKHPTLEHVLLLV